MSGIKPDTRFKVCCRKCGSSDVHVDASAAWNEEFQFWEVVNTFEKGAVCEPCGEARGRWDFVDLD